MDADDIPPRTAAHPRTARRRRTAQKNDKQTPRFSGRRLQQKAGAPHCTRKTPSAFEHVIRTSLRRAAFLFGRLPRSAPQANSPHLRCRTWSLLLHCVRTSRATLLSAASCSLCMRKWLLSSRMLISVRKCGGKHRLVRNLLGAGQTCDATAVPTAGPALGFQLRTHARAIPFSHARMRTRRGCDLCSS